MVLGRRDIGVDVAVVAVFLLTNKKKKEKRLLFNREKRWMFDLPLENGDFLGPKR